MLVHFFFNTYALRGLIKGCELLMWKDIIVSFMFSVKKYAGMSFVAQLPPDSTLNAGFVDGYRNLYSVGCYGFSNVAIL